MNEFVLGDVRVDFDPDQSSFQKTLPKYGDGPFILVQIRSTNLNFQVYVSKGYAFRDSIERQVELVFNSRKILITISGALYIVDINSHPVQVECVSKSACYIDICDENLIIVDRWSVMVLSEEKKNWERSKIAIDGFEEIKIKDNKIFLVGDSLDAENEQFVFDIRSGERL
jgi:hypothetical protein